MRSATSIFGKLSIERPTGRGLLILSLAAAVALGWTAPGATQVAQDRRSPQALNLPSFRQAVPGLLVRTRFVAKAGAGTQVELWDLLIGPGHRSDRVRLPGPAVLEVRGGAGAVLINQKRQDLRAGASLAIPEGASLLFANARRDLGLDLRVTIVVGGPK